MRRIEAPWARKRMCEVCHLGKSPRKFLKVDGYVASFWSTCSDCRPWVPEKRNRGRSSSFGSRSIDEQLAHGVTQWSSRPGARRASAQGTKQGYDLRMPSKYGLVAVTRIILDGEHDAYGQPSSTELKVTHHRKVPLE